MCVIIDRMFLDRIKRRNVERSLPSDFDIIDEVAQQDWVDTQQDVFDYVLAANLLFQILLALKKDCLEKGQHDMWRVFAARRIEPASTGQRLKHEVIAQRLGLPRCAAIAQFDDVGRSKIQIDRQPCLARQ